MSNTTITPSIGAVRFTTNLVPQLGSGAVGLAGGLPQFSWNIFNLEGGAGAGVTMQLAGVAPILQLSAPTSTGAIAFSGVAPVVNTASAAITPSAGAVSAAGRHAAGTGAR